MPFLIHALSPLHAGTGQGIDVVDLPIARLKGMGIPFAPGSSVKGALRDERRGSSESGRLEAVFGPDRNNASDHAGALIVGDARLLLLPVRSFIGTFSWVTSPLLLGLARRDLAEAFGADAVDGLTVPRIDAQRALVTQESRCVHKARLYLEDLDLPAEQNASLARWAEWLGTKVSPDEPGVFGSRFSVVDDDTMTFLWETATQVDARIRIDERTRTVDTGALWLEESLPSETVLIGLCGADRSRRQGVDMKAAEVLDFVFGSERTVQFGGKASVGRGRCRLIRLESCEAK